jgi:hypothetical protein
MIKAREFPWLRISAEMSAIAISILLAFWIQAWWDGRQDRLHEQVILSSLLDEFRELKMSLEWEKTYNEAIRHSIRQLLDAAVGPKNTLSDKDVDRLIADLWWNQDLSTWSAPELSSIISSGDLALVSNFKLRQQLGKWQIALENLRGTMQRDLDFFTDRQMPLLAELTLLTQIANADDGQPGHPDVLYDGGRRVVLKSHVSHGGLLADRKFQNMLVQRDQFITDIIFFAYSAMEENLNETISLLEQELNLVEE